VTATTAPPRVSTGWTIGRVFEHRFLQYRRTYRSTIFSSFLTPVLFLAAMGLGIGAYVDPSSMALLGGVPYIAFLAPGLLAATCMQSASFEATFPIMGGLMWNRTFHAMFATPITAAAVALGNLAWIGARLVMIATVFLVVIVLFGAVESPLAIFAIPIGVLTGLAFAAPIAAFAATQRTPETFAAIFRFGIMPLFLFSGTFYPIEALPPLLQPLAWLSPLYHGVWLARGCTLGTIVDEPGLAIVHLVVLSTFVVVGSYAAVRTVGARLVRG
jgi:lipooligosaccharide transport system permease protein